MTTITFIGIGPRSKCPQPDSTRTSYRRGVQWSRGRQAVPGEAYTYGSWRGVFDCLRPRRDVFDAIDATTAWEPARRPGEGCPRGPRLTSCSVEAPLIVAGEGSRRRGRERVGTHCAVMYHQGCSSSSSSSVGGKSSPTETRNLLFRLILARRPSSYSDKMGSTGAALVLRRCLGRGAGGALRGRLRDVGSGSRIVTSSSGSKSG